MRIRSATTVAMVAHALAFGAIALVPLRMHVETRPPATDAIDLEEDSDEIAAPEQPADPQPATVVSTAPMHPARATDLRAAIAHTDAPPSSTPSPDSTPEPAISAPADDGTWTFNVAARKLDVTSRGLVTVTPGAPSVPDAPSKPSTGSPTGGVTEALDAHDLTLGISRGGEVLSVMEAVARTGNLPVRGNATYVVTVDARGAVSVALQDASEGFDAWSREIGAMRDAVAKRHVRLPPGAKGLQIKVRLESRVQYADGHDPRADGTRVKATGFKLSETKNQIVIEEIPSVTVGTRGKVCGVGVTLSLGGLGINGGCSPENIGSGEMRIVSGKIVSESRL